MPLIPRGCRLAAVGSTDVVLVRRDTEFGLWREIEKRTICGELWGAMLGASLSVIAELQRTLQPVRLKSAKLFPLITRSKTAALFRKC